MLTYFIKKEIFMSKSINKLLGVGAPAINVNE